LSTKTIPPAHEPPEEDDVEEGPVEAVVAVHERQMETPDFAEESRKRDLRLLRVVFHDLCDPCLLQELEAAIREPRRLVGIEGDVSGLQVGVF
jgi:hypothetical protein